MQHLKLNLLHYNQHLQNKELKQAVVIITWSVVHSVRGEAWKKKKIINLVILVVSSRCIRAKAQRKMLIWNPSPLPLLFLACHWEDSALFLPPSHLFSVLLFFSG